jgi:DNA/RNA endonuclease YhcR with UshA esterase domain
MLEMLARLKFIAPLLMLILIGSGCSWLFFGVEEQALDSGQLESMTVTGTVVSTIDDCAFDAICAYVLETDAGEVNVIWSEGRTIEPCQGTIQPEIQIGDFIEAYGAPSDLLDGETITICPDVSYYVSTLMPHDDESDNPTDAPMDDAQVQSVTGTVVGTVDDCAFDGICAYVVDTGAGEVNVIWSEGMTMNGCQGEIGPNIQVGDAVEAMGAVSTALDGESISVCGDASYYVRQA